MPAGTIYMYYALGSDSLNISAEGEGNAVLIKSACFFQDQLSDPDALQIMQQLMYRFINADFCHQCTRNPLTQRNSPENRDYQVHKQCGYEHQAETYANASRTRLTFDFLYRRD